MAGPAIDPELFKDVSLCELVWSFDAGESIVGLSVSPKGKAVAVASIEDELPVLDAETGKARWTLPGHAGGINGVAFLGGNTLASVGEDGKAVIWNLAKAGAQHTLAVQPLDADR